MSGADQAKTQATLGCLSISRTRPYRAATDSDDHALELYLWNARLAGELHQALTLVEVVLRNAIDVQLRHWNTIQAQTLAKPFGLSWIERPAPPLWAILNPKSKSGGRHSTYQTALARAELDRQARTAGHPRHRAPVSHDDLVAHLTFGTWVNLLPRRQQGSQPGPPRQLRLWQDAIAAAFQSKQNPQVIHFWASRLRDLRNRVAHVRHEVAQFQ
jgi:hypothetical protein